MKRRPIFVLATGLLLLGGGVPGTATADDDAGVRAFRDVVFATVDGRELKLDLFVPRAAEKPPLLVWVHGGGWRAGSRGSVPLKGLTAHGYAVASIEYRFTETAIFPAQIHDCKAAIRWLRAKGGDYGCDADWIAVGGSSAGGHLALLLGTSGGVAELEGTLGDHLGESSTVQAVLDYFGPSDFVLRGKTHPERAYTTKSGSFALLGGMLNGKVDPELERTASPTHYVDEGDPPLLVFQGTKDETVLPDQSERIVALYKKTGLEATLVPIEGAGHGGKRFFDDEQLARARKFLDAHRPRKRGTDDAE